MSFLNINFKKGNEQSIFVQATGDMMFAELALKYFQKTGVSNEDQPQFIFNSQSIPTDSCRTLTELNIRDGAKIEDYIIKEITPKDKNNNDKLYLNTNIKKNSKQNIDLYFLPKRVDRFGTPISKGGKQKVTFIDRITKNNFTYVIKVESFKEFNKMEEVSSTKKNNCCLIL